MKTYFITTYGCQLNVHESEKLAGILQNLGYKEAPNLKDADVIIYNTCAIRGGAENRAIGNIGSLKKLKKNYPNKIIAVGGCMTQQINNAEMIYQKFPFVDIIFGTSNLHLFETFLKEKELKGERRIYNDENYTIEAENCLMYRTSGENAWVNIMQGCNNFCTYCIVPYVRGRERSRKKEDIIAEIKQILKNKKYKKITLLGQNVNSYGSDTHETNFANLLKEICSLKGDFKLTFMTSHPKDITSEIIDVIANQPKILKEIHLPLQSGSNKILKLMNRNYTVERYLNIIEEIKEKIPNVYLSTDIIVGFPNESKEDFNQTCEIIKKVQFDNVFAFMFSKRKGTPAEKMVNQIDEEVKNKRVNYILNLAKEYKKRNHNNGTK